MGREPNRRYCARVPGADVGPRTAEGIDVVVLGPGLDGAYEDFVHSHPHALVYHSLRFRDFLVDLLGCTPRYGVALAGGRVDGVLPLMATDGPYGTVLNSLPYFGSNGGVLAGGPAARAALAAWYGKTVAGSGVAATTVIANPLDPDAPAPAHDFADVRVGCMTPLGGTGDAGQRLLAAIDGSARRNVAKAARSGVEVEVDNAAFGALEEMHRSGMEAIGGRAKTPEFFAAVPRRFRAGDDYDLYVARIGDVVVAGLLVFFYGMVAEYYVPATRPEHRSEQPLAAILHRAMTDAMGRGLGWWNWGGSWMSQENLIRFKTKWGGQRREYRYWTKVNNDDILSARPQDLLDGYPGFFVAPFTSLGGARGAVG